MEAKKKKFEGSVRVDKDILKEAKFICLKKETSIQEYTTEAIKEKNKKEKTK